MEKKIKMVDWARHRACVVCAVFETVCYTTVTAMGVGREQQALTSVFWCIRSENISLAAPLFFWTDWGKGLVGTTDVTFLWLGRTNQLSVSINFEFQISNHAPRPAH